MTADKRPTVIIERLEFCSFLLSLVFRRPGRTGFFIHASPPFQKSPLRRLAEIIGGLRPLRYEDFPGSFVEVQTRTAGGLNDAFYDSCQGPERDAVVAFLRRIQNHALMEAALRRVMVDAYTLNRMKALVFLKNISFHDEAVRLIPADNRDPGPWASSDLSRPWQEAKIPFMARWINSARIPLETAGLMLYAAASVLYLLCQRGLCFRSPPVRRWRVGVDLFNWGILWSNPTIHFFLYGKGDLAQQAVLHVVRNRLEDEKTRQYFETEGIPYVEASKLPIPIGYALRKIFWQFLMKFLWLALRHGLNGRSVPLLRGAAVVISPNFFRADILELTHQTQAFVSRDEYGVTHILRTLLYDARGGTTIGFSHGDDCFPTEATSYMCDHVYCLPGEYYRELFQRNSRFTPKTPVIGIGILGLDKTYQCKTGKSFPANYGELRQRHTLIGVFASNYKEDFYITRQSTFRFYQAAMALLKKIPNAVLVIRPKLADLEMADPEFHKLIGEGGSKVIVETAVSTYELLPALHLAVCIATCTVGLEAFMAEIPVIYYDEGEFTPHPYGRYDAALLARTPEALSERAENVLKKNIYADPKVLEFIRSHHGYRFDGKVVERFQNEIEAALLHPSSPNLLSPS